MAGRRWPRTRRPTAATASCIISLKCCQVSSDSVWSHLRSLCWIIPFDWAKYFRERWKLKKVTMPMMAVKMIMLMTLMMQWCNDAIRTQCSKSLTAFQRLATVKRAKNFFGIECCPWLMQRQLSVHQGREKAISPDQEASSTHIHSSKESQ